MAVRGGLKRGKKDFPLLGVKLNRKIVWLRRNCAFRMSIQLATFSLHIITIYYIDQLNDFCSVFLY